ncbi:MAG: cation:dicarboxylase symporter family transporter, partial [Flavobacteriaceae bacterium]
MKRIELHWQILIGMLLGLIFGYLMTQFSFGKGFVVDWIKPFGTIFIKLLKLIAIPLILASLVKGISDLKDIGKFKLIGIRTLALFVGTTIVAISIGLVLANAIGPGKGIPQETIAELTNTYANDQAVQSKLAAAAIQKESGPLQFIEDMVPDNA